MDLQIAEMCNVEERDTSKKGGRENFIRRSNRKIRGFRIFQKVGFLKRDSRKKRTFHQTNLSNVL